MRHTLATTALSAFASVSGAVALAMALPGAASAHVYDLTYTVSGVGAVDLVLTTQDFLSAGSYGDLGYKVTGISGTRNGVAVTGLSTTYSADNVVFTSAPAVDYAGLAYSTGASDYGLFWVNAARSRAEPGAYGECYASGCNYGVPDTYNAVTGLSLTSAVPEPTAWAMLAVGFGMMGGLMRRRTVAARV